MAGRPRRAEAGFTLVELLVALALLGLLTLLLFSGLRQGVRSWDAVESGSETIDSLVATQTLLRDQLGAISRDGEVAGFSGGAEGLAFTSTWLQHLPVAGSYRIEIRAVTDDTSGLALVFDWRPVGEPVPGGRAAGTQARVVGRRLLLKDLASIRFRYWGDPSREGKSMWHQTWSFPHPPRLVRLDLVLAEKGRSLLPLMIAIP